MFNMQMRSRTSSKPKIYTNRGNQSTLPAQSKLDCELTTFSWSCRAVDQASFESECFQEPYITSHQSLYVQLKMGATSEVYPSSYPITAEIDVKKQMHFEEGNTCENGSPKALIASFKKYINKQKWYWRQAQPRPADSRDGYVESCGWLPATVLQRLRNLAKAV